MNITRTGKIARLPHAIRDQLNQRLQDGEKARSLVAWLNSSPEVQAILAADFGAKPIRPQNLSEWRHGGYRDWLHHQQALEFARSFTEEARELQASATSTAPGLPAIAPLATAGLPTVVPQTKEEERRPPVDPPLTHLLAVWLAARYALLTRALDPADPQHWRRLRELCADVVKLRHSDHAAERLRLDRQRLAAHVQHGETRESDQIRPNPAFESNPSSQSSCNTKSPDTMHLTHTGKIARPSHRHLVPPPHPQPGGARKSDRIRLNPTFESSPNHFPGNGLSNGSRRNNRSSRAPGSRL